MERKTHTIDATGKAVGRLAADISVLLRGKNKPSFLPYLDNGDFVVIKNLDKIKILQKRSEKKIYYHHTSYMGGLKGISQKDLFKKNPAEVLKRAVYGMLPKNKLRPKQIKRLKIEK